jgi:hypothetical protein
MANRVRLTWNRNQDDETEHYRVFRSESGDINDQNRMEHLVMRVEHPDHINPIKVENEKLKRHSSRTYLLEHKNILMGLNGVTFPFLLLVNGSVVEDFTLDTQEGHVLFEYDLPHTAEVIVQEYTFDGVQVWDYGIEEDEKIYYGPEAKDNSAPTPPSLLVMDRDYDRNRIALRWKSSVVSGKTFFYRIDSAIDSNHYSRLSETKKAILSEPLADRGYLIERSRDGIKWQEIAKIKGTIFYEYMVDREAPNPVRRLSAGSYLYPNQSYAQITLNWDKVQDTTTSETSLYRVRGVNRIGAISEPSNIVGPVPFKVGLKEIVIRRKINDGTLPTFDGDDAETVARISDLSVTSFIEDVLDNRIYIYGIWIVDRGSNRSAITYTTVDVGDATAPTIPLNLSAEPFQLVVG